MVLKRLSVILRIACTMVMSFISGAVNNGLVIPHQINCGGTGGIALILRQLVDLPVWTITFVIQIILFFVGAKQVNKRFAFVMVGSILAMTAGQYVFEGSDPFIQNEILAMLVGAVIVGAATGVIMAMGFSTGGIVAVDYILVEKFGRTPGFYDNIINGVIMLGMLPFFQFHKLILSLAFLLISNLALNWTRAWLLPKVSHD